MPHPYYTRDNILYLFTRYINNTEIRCFGGVAAAIRAYVCVYARLFEQEL